MVEKVGMDRVKLIQECGENFLQKYLDYNDDIQIISFNTNYNNWIRRCEDDDTLLLLMDMITKYIYIPRQLIYKQWGEINKYIQTIQSPIIYSWIQKKEKKINSSFDYIRDYIDIHKIDDNLFVDMIN